MPGFEQIAPPFSKPANEGYQFHPDVLYDLDDIREFIARDNPKAADDFIEQIIEKIELAAQFPKMGHRNDELSSRPLRFLHVHDYVIAYAEEEGFIWIVAVVHGRRNPQVLAAIFRNRQ